MNQLNLFIELTRLKKPIGYMLLFWPCAWGLTLAYDFSNNLNIYFFYQFLFFLGSVLMRSAGCIINDILDRKFDKKVYRTKDRPIASGKITVSLGLIYAGFLCVLAFLVLINFNYFTILIALASMPLAFTYPLMKRFTYWPQLFLGITFNYGLILGWTSINSNINLVSLIFYFGAIFWTLGYDTIYGVQDISDDEVIGVKSTAIKFKNNLNFFVISCYSLSSIAIILVMLNLNINYSLIFLGFFIFTLVYQIKIFKIKKPSNCLKAFKINNWSGLMIFLSFFFLNFNI